MATDKALTIWKMNKKYLTAFFGFFSFRDTDMVIYKIQTLNVKSRLKVSDLLFEIVILLFSSSTEQHVLKLKEN